MTSRKNKATHYLEPCDKEYKGSLPYEQVRDYLLRHKFAEVDIDDIFCETPDMPTSTHFKELSNMYIEKGLHPVRQNILKLFSKTFQNTIDLKL